jgi:hypothetical protein
VHVDANTDATPHRLNGTRQRRVSEPSWEARVLETPSNDDTTRDTTYTHDTHTSTTRGEETRDKDTSKVELADASSIFDQFVYSINYAIERLTAFRLQAAREGFENPGILQYARERIKQLMTETANIARCPPNELISATLDEDAISRVISRHIAEALKQLPPHPAPSLPPPPSPPSPTSYAAAAPSQPRKITKAGAPNTKQPSQPTRSEDRQLIIEIHPPPTNINPFPQSAKAEINKTINANNKSSTRLEVEGFKWTSNRNIVLFLGPTTPATEVIECVDKFTHLLIGRPPNTTITA